MSCIRLDLQLKPKCRGSLFCHLSGSPAFTCRYHVEPVFNMVLKIRFKTRMYMYKTHSFRFGTASSAWASRASQRSIANEGRWKSSCFPNYMTVSPFKKYLKVLGWQSYLIFLFMYQTIIFILSHYCSFIVLFCVLSTCSRLCLDKGRNNEI